MNQTVTASALSPSERRARGESRRTAAPGRVRDAAETPADAPREPAPAPVVAPVPVSTPKLWLTSGDVAKLLSMGVRTVWRLVAQGQLPQPERFTRKLVRWDRQELLDFVQNLRDARQQAQREGKE
jgi:predicted DNA-binding transcriptional regulator AlpA